MKNKKNMKKLVASFALLALAAAMSSTTTFAWFSMNRNVSAAGIGAKAKAAETLVIGRGINVGSEIEVDFSESDPRSGKNAISPAQLTPSKWAENANGNTVSGLKVVTGGTVNSGTGKVTGGEWNSVLNGTETYYQDYELFFAARGGQLQGTLKVDFDDLTITSALTNLLGVRSTVKAYTIKFFAASVTADDTNVFMGAPIAELKVADIFKTGGHQAVSLGTFTFPQQTEDNYASAIKVGMRLFLDGDLPVVDGDYVNAGTKDVGAGTTGKILSGKTYYTYSNGTFTPASGLNVGDDATGYYVQSNDACYVYTDTVNTNEFTFGLAFTVA